MSPPAAPLTGSARVLRRVEPLISTWRGATLAVLGGLTLVFAWQAAHLRPDAGWLKMVPASHPYMQTFSEYYQTFGGANTVLIAFKHHRGDIYDPAFMETLRQAEQDVFNVPGVDRARVNSIFSPAMLYIEVVEGGLAGENVIPSDYAPTPEMMARIRANVAKAHVIGRLVSEDQTTALIQFELLERDPAAGTMRQQVAAAEPFWAGLQHAWNSASDLAGRWQALAAWMTRHRDDAGAGLDYVQVGAALEAIRARYATEAVSVHIVGFAKVVDDMTQASLEVAGFFLIALLLTGLLLWRYVGSLRLAALVVGTSLVACIWELGLLRLAGFGLDPFALLVPFLILAVSVSHGVQYVNAWADAVARGQDRGAAALGTFRVLAIPGVVALITDMAGFGTIYLIDIQIIREMSIHAVLGMLGVIVVNKLLLPALLGYVRLPDPQAFARAEAERQRRGEIVFRRLAVVTRRGPALAVLAVCAGLTVFGLFQYPKVRIGDTTEGVPELRPDSRFNRDARAIAADFTMGVDHLKVIGESFEDGCIDHGVMSELDRFSWYLQNQPGVRGVLSLIELAKLANAGLNEGRLDAESLPRDPRALAQITALVPTTTGFLTDTCDALALFVFTADHRAETIDALIDAVNHYTDHLQQDRRVRLRLASGNIGVMAATNEEVRRNELPVIGWVYAVIALFLWLSFRTRSGVLCVILPLALVTLLSYALMVALDIGQKAATLPVLALATGIGVDYGIYAYAVLAAGLRRGLSLEQAYIEKMRSTGRATLFTGVALSLGVALWLFSGLQFQRDMGALLVFAFSANLIGAIVVIPALAHFLGGEERRRAGRDSDPA